MTVCAWSVKSRWSRVSSLDDTMTIVGKRQAVGGASDVRSWVYLAEAKRLVVWLVDGRYPMTVQQTVTFAKIGHVAPIGMTAGKNMPNGMNDEC